MVKRDQPLAEVWAKIERANDNINDLNTKINALINSDVYHFVSEPHANATESILRIIGPEPPLYFSTIIGDIVQQLRSSLNLLICALVIKNGNSVTRIHEFPICDTPKRFKTACERGKIKGISLAAKKAIWFRQPYRRSIDLKKNFLYVLRELSNTDKHRDLIAVLTLGHARDLDISASPPSIKKSKEKNANKHPLTIIGIYPIIGSQRPTEEGTEVLRFVFSEPEPYFKVNSKPVINIVFSDLGIMPKQPIIYIIKQISKKTAALIKSFEELEFS